MKFTFTRNLPKTERYISSKRYLKATLGHIDSLDVNFGLRRKFEFDSRCTNKPKINGLVVVSVSVNRSREGIVSFYPVTVSGLPDTAISAFQENILQKISAWIDGVVGKSDASILGVEQLIVEFEDNSFRFHHVTFL
ncbi:hypothetical protein [Paenibacillus chibensis]|uniref:hypothetical protein n=1 Tax=Paenibacillus chibensis TaxID=59846 RepID=UPI000FD8FDA5|nr:hypothetical protein [Paenibacillus chibensis]MEC0368995.1 hypothetical protein [Paenibacillus chibensis]